MSGIIGIPTTRISNLFVSQQLMRQIQHDRRELFRLERQLSTGRRIDLPSEDPSAAMRVIGTQRLIEQKQQIGRNLQTGQSYLSATDVALSGVAETVAEVRAAALGAINTVYTDEQREAVANQVDSAIASLVRAGNKQFRGRHLFAGAVGLEPPFARSGQSEVEYTGGERRLASFSDLDTRFDINVAGSEVFGALSEPVLGTVDLNPVVTLNTRLDDLRGGQGVSDGRVAVSADGVTSTVDLSGAETIGDVALLLRSNPPQGTALNVEITPTGLKIELDAPPGTLLRIEDVGAGTTAAELGILAETGVAGPVESDDLDPILRRTTRLADAFGTPLDLLSGLQIQNGGETHVVDFDGAETVEDLLDTLNGAGAGLLAEINATATGVNLRSRISGADFTVGENGGTTAAQLGIRSFTRDTLLEDLNYGRGVGTEDGPDFTVTLADGAVAPIEIDVSGLKTVGELLDLINAQSPGNLEARLATVGNGIELKDYTAGAGVLTVQRAGQSRAAIDLGLIPPGATEHAAGSSPPGQPDLLRGTDVHPLEVDGLFTALLRLSAALRENSLGEAERAMEMLDRATRSLNFARAELGVRQQGLDVVRLQLEDEQVNLQEAVSLDLDADLVEVISDFQTRQVALEASLATSAQILRLSLLNYL